ncbi:hypothetical protein J6590_067415, partial [Homalodisca vitripennis]
YKLDKDTHKFCVKESIYRFINDGDSNLSIGPLTCDKNSTCDIKQCSEERPRARAVSPQDQDRHVHSTEKTRCDFHDCGCRQGIGKDCKVV